MHPRKLLRASLLTTLALAAACDQPAGVDAEGLSPAEVASLAPVYEEMANAELGSLGVPSYSTAPDGPQAAPTTTTTTFTRVRSCPAGGSVQVAGTLVHTWDREARTASHQYNATRTEQACAVTLRGGGTLTINGNPNTAVTGSWGVTNGVPGVRTLTQVGSFTWAHSGGRSGTCNVNLTTTWNPATHTARVQGTFCNRTIDVTHTRDR